MTQPRLVRLLDCLRRQLKFSRQARRRLRLQAHKPIPIATYVPKFGSGSTSSSYLRARDPDEARAEAAKLRRAHRDARKGALRELRKDARFLAGVQRRERQEKDGEYADWLHKVHASLEEERAEDKALEKEKGRVKRRAGRK
jgi:nucleolar protein 14